MSPYRQTLIERKERFPRVSGDEPPPPPVIVVLGWFSPRERG